VWVLNVRVSGYIAWRREISASRRSCEEGGGGGGGGGIESAIVADTTDTL
jgi:hypothetical protein